MSASVEAGWSEPNPKRQRRNGSWDEDDSRLMLQMMLGQLQYRHSHSQNNSYGDANFLGAESSYATESTVRETETLDLLGRACCSDSDENIDNQILNINSGKEDHINDNNKTENNVAVPEISATDVDFDSVPVPVVGWEKCLDLQTGRIYYIDRTRNVKQNQMNAASAADKFKQQQTPPRSSHYPDRFHSTKKQTFNTMMVSVPDLNSPATPDLNDPAMPDDDDDDVKSYESTTTTTTVSPHHGSIPTNCNSMLHISNSGRLSPILKLHNTRKGSTSSTSGNIGGGKRKASTDFAARGSHGEVAEMVTVVCSKCLMLVMLSTAEPRCPNCRSAIPL